MLSNEKTSADNDDQSLGNAHWRVFRFGTIIKGLCGNWKIYVFLLVLAPESVRHSVDLMIGSHLIGAVVVNTASEEQQVLPMQR